MALKLFNHSKVDLSGIIDVWREKEMKKLRQDVVLLYKKMHY